MSELRANTISNAAGTGPVTLTGQYAAKAWVNFDGTGTVAIRESENVTSITDNGTGNYTVTFSSLMASGSYAVAPSTSNDSSIRTDGVFGVVPFEATRFRIVTNAATTDVDNITAATHGDLA
jgi:hypothetical protein